MLTFRAVQCTQVDLIEMQQLKLQQCSDIRFCVRSGLSQVETKARLEAIYGQRTFSQPTIHRWWTRFQTGDEGIRDKPHPGAVLKRTADKVAQVQDLLDTDRRATVHHLATFTDISKSTAHTILTKDLQKKKQSARWVPHNLSQANKD